MTATPKASVRAVDLKAALESDDQSVRFNAGLDLVKTGETAGVPALIEAFAHESRVVRLFHASRALTGLGSVAIPQLEAALEHPNGQVRIDAAYTLSRIDPARLPSLLPHAATALSDENPEVVADAIFWLGETGSAAGAMVPTLIARLQAPAELKDEHAWARDPRVPVAALLARIGEPVEPIVTALTAMLRVAEPSGRWGAARALGQMGMTAIAATPVLEAIVRDETEVEAVRVEAAYALAVMVDPANEMVPLLLDVLQDADWWMRVYAARLLGEIGAPPAGEEPPTDSWLDQSSFAARDVRRVAELEPAAVAALSHALTDTNGNVRRNAAWALSRLGARAIAAADALVAALDVPDCAPVAAEALACIGADAVPVLGTLLGVEAGTARRRLAAYALRLIGTPEALELLADVEQQASLGEFRPAAHHFYLQVPVTWDQAKLDAFASLFEVAAAQDPSSPLDYTLPYPKHEFLRYLVEHKGMLLHGSAKTDIDLLKPLRWSTDSADYGNVSGVYADKDYVRPIYFAVMHRDRCFGLNNGFVDLTEDGEISAGEDQGFDRRFYRLAIGVNGLRRDPWRDGMVYVLPPDTFELWNEWTSRVPVAPVMRILVAPHDLPLWQEVWSVDWRQRGLVWIDPNESFPSSVIPRGRRSGSAIARPGACSRCSVPGHSHIVLLPMAL